MWPMFDLLLLGIVVAAKDDFSIDSSNWSSSSLSRLSSFEVVESRRFAPVADESLLLGPLRD